MKTLIIKIKEILPGFIVCLVIGIIAQLFARFIPNLGAALIAIFIGILVGNTILKKECYNIGTKFSESKLLEYSIVLTGLTLNLTDIMGVGGVGIIFISCQMTLTIIIAYLIGKWLGFDKKFSLLMCAGNAVCGSSAIGTIAPVIHADSKSKGLSITIVNVTGTLLMILLPILTGLLYHHETLPTSGMIGGVLQSIGQVIASAKLVGGDIVEMATIFKIIRIIFVIIVAIVFSKMNTENGEKLFSKGKYHSTSKVKAGIPWFIIGFFLLSIVNSLNFVPPFFIAIAKLISGQFEIIALAAIGMRVKISDLKKEGPRGLLYGCLVGACQILFATTLIALLF